MTFSRLEQFLLNSQHKLQKIDSICFLTDKIYFDGRVFYTSTFPSST